MEVNLRLTVLVAGFTLASGIFDSLAFTHAASMWKDGRLIWLDAAKSAGSFVLGMTMYCVAVRYLSEAGVIQAEIQTLLWFVITLVGVAILGGRFFEWQPLEQLVAINVLFCLGWLISRTAA
jgi:hypothetical protein